MVLDWRRCTVKSVTTVCTAVENTADSKDATSLGDRIITPRSSSPSAMTMRDVIMAM
jgi:hypothetical protein